MFRIMSVLKSGFLTPNVDNFGFLDSLKVMLRGMLLLFLVTGVLILMVIILNKYSNRKKSKEQEQNK